MKPRHLGAAFLCLVLAYPLSFGPVARIYLNAHPKASDTSKGINAFYYPVFLLRGVPVAGPIFDWYEDLWIPPQEWRTRHLNEMKEMERGEVIVN